MLKVDDYCFNCNPAHKPNFNFIISIYQVTEIVDEIVDEPPKILAKLIYTSSSLNEYWLYPRTMSHYTKCSSTTIEELKEEFPEVFI
jgi:hypothetical protein